MRVCLEATSLLAHRSGVGHTTAELARALVNADPDVEVSLLPLSARGSGRLRSVAPQHPRIRALRARVPARLTSWIWQRSTWPPAELFCGAVDVFHGPNFLLPPLLKAAGVVTIHDLAFVRIPEACSPHVRTYTHTVPVAARRANRIVVPSAFVASELADWLPDSKDRIRIVRPGVRDVFGPGGHLASPLRDSLGLREAYVVYVGNLEARKNLDLLLRAFTVVLRTHEHAQLVLVGAPGPGWDRIADLHAGLLGSRAVVRPGYLPDAEVAALIRGARAFVYPSRYEGFGMPPVEAMACRTPVVATDIPALSETLGGHAELVGPDDADALAVAITRHLEHAADPELLDAAAAHAASFTWTRTASEALAVYREALDEVRA